MLMYIVFFFFLEIVDGYIGLLTAWICLIVSIQVCKIIVFVLTVCLHVVNNKIFIFLRVNINVASRKI